MYVTRIEDRGGREETDIRREREHREETSKEAQYWDTRHREQEDIREGKYN